MVGVGRHLKEDYNKVVFGVSLLCGVGGATVGALRSGFVVELSQLQVEGPETSSAWHF